MKNTIIKVLSLVMAMVMIMGTVLVVSVSAADECKHENYEQYGDPVPATCTEWGFTLYQCSDCKKDFKAEFNTLEKPHNATLGYSPVVKEEVKATCSADAYKVIVCNICNTEVIDVEEGTKSDEFHAWSEYTIVEATCTEAGNKTRTCAICAKVDTVALSVEGHKWVALEDQMVEPKCEWYLAAYGIEDEKLAYGSMPYECKECDATRTVVIEPVDYHTYIDMAAEADTCEVIGHNEGSFCKWCKAGETAEDVVVDTIKHNWTTDWSKEYKAATCDTDGFCTMKCSNCSESYVKTLKAEGHDFDEENPTTYVEATCTTWGYKLFGCTKCGNKFTNVTIEPLGHKWAEEGTPEDPTCTKPGRIEYACTNSWHKGGVEIFCDETNDVENTNAPAYGHKWDDGTDATEARDAEPADCLNPGTAAGKWCNRCNEWAEGGKEIPALGHANITSVCTVAGLMDTLCSRCGYIADGKEGEEVTITGGKESHALIVIGGEEAECTTPGVELLVCKYCDKYAVEALEKTIPATGHTTKETKQDATCVAPGWELVTCEVCDAQISYKDLPVDPNGHTFAEGALAVAPTCDEPGYEHGMCLNCGFVTEKDLPALGHDIVNIPAKAATCTEPGNKAGYYCKRADCEYGLEAEEIDPLGHDDQTAKSVIAGYDPTCTTKGLSDGKKCLRCDKITVEQEEEPAYNHYYEGVQYSVPVVVEASCKDDGQIGYTANECYWCDAAVITGYLDVPAHDWAADWTKKNVTCETDGYEYRLCGDCGATQIKEDSTVKATGHKNAAGEAIVASCTRAEGFDNKCTNAHCNYADKKVPATHNYVMDDPTVSNPCEGYSYLLYVCEDCGLKKVESVGTSEPAHDWEVTKAPAEGATATPQKALETAYKCKACGETKTEYKSSGINYKYEIKNLSNPGFNFVNGTKKLQVVISIFSDKKEFHNVFANFTYDKSVLEFKDFTVATTISDAPIDGLVYKVEDGKLNFTAFVGNNEDGEVTNVVLTGEAQTFVTLEFAVKPEAAAGATDVKMTNIAFTDMNGAKVGSAYAQVAAMSATICALGDANKDGKVTSADFAAVQKLILTDGYLAEADIDGDGAVKAKDLSLLQKLIVGSYSVATLAGNRK